MENLKKCTPILSDILCTPHYRPFSILQSLASCVACSSCNDYKQPLSICCTNGMTKGATSKRLQNGYDRNRPLQCGHSSIEDFLVKWTIYRRHAVPSPWLSRRHLDLVLARVTCMWSMHVTQIEIAWDECASWPAKRGFVDPEGLFAMLVLPE